MPLSTPTSSTALTNTQAAEAAQVAAANTAFEQTLTALILSAIPLGKFQISAPIADNVDYNAVSAYFTGLGYTVTLTLPPPQFFGTSLPVPVFPGPPWPAWNRMAPPPSYPDSGWTAWEQYVRRHRPLVGISWGTAP